MIKAITAASAAALCLLAPALAGCAATLNPAPGAEEVAGRGAVHRATCSTNSRRCW